MSRAIISDFIMLLAITVCLVGFHETAPPPRRNTKPVVDFASTETLIQFASQFPSSTDENPL